MNRSFDSTTPTEFEYLLSTFESGLSLIKRASNQDLIIVYGDTGSGKSTTINYLLDCSMEREKNKVFVKRDSIIPEFTKIGHSSQSETIFPFIVGNWRLKFMDCPGIDPNQEPLKKIVNSISIKKAIDSAKTVKILFLIDYKTCFGGRDKGLKELMRIARDFFKSEEIFRSYKCSIFDRSLET